MEDSYEKYSKDNDQQKIIYTNRRHKLRKMIIEKGLDCLLVTQPTNRFYLSGFALHDTQPNESSGCLVIMPDGRDWLATDSRYELAAKQIWDPERVFIYGANGTGTLADLLVICGSVIGIEESGVTIDFAKKLKRPIKYNPAYIAADGMVESLRVCKDENEIKALKKSFNLNHAMLAWLENKVYSEDMHKINEKELSWQIERYFRENGAQELAFENIVAAGPNAALPHAEATDKIIYGDQPLLVDVGCRVENYCSDQTRTWWIGLKPTPEFEKTMDLVRKAQQAAMLIMKPGIPCADVYKAAAKIFADAGVEKAFTHGLGHGVGLQTHEAPSLSSKSKDILRKGMVVTVEPGLYYADWGGIRWENTVLVEEDGITVL